MMSTVRRFVKNRLRKHGLHIARIPRNGVRGVSLEEDLRTLIPESSPTCFDVGANKGQTIELFRTVFSHPNIYAFEPSSQTFGELSNKKFGDGVKLFNIALGDTNKTADFINYEWSTLSSFFELQKCEGNPFHAIDQRVLETVAVRTVDWIVAEERIANIDLLKIDTQGYELSVLQGATDSLDKRLIKNILAELTFAPLYQGQSNPLDVLLFLEAHHFGLVDFYEKVFDGQKLAWCTSLFRRR